MWCSGTRASAESSRMVISVRPISREKMQVARPCLIAAERAKSRPSVLLPSAGRAASDDHLAGVQPVGQVVEVGEPGGYAGHAAAARADRLDLVERGRHDVLEPDVVLGGAPLGDLVDRRLGAVDDLVDLAVAAVAELDDAGAGLDQAAQHRPLGWTILA